MKAFPKDYDPIVYRDKNPDLKHFDDQSLSNHYQTHGKSEGRVCSEIQSSTDFYELIKIKNEKALEIGPLDNPKLNFMLPNVRSIDYTSLDNLRKKYKDDPNVDIERIIKTDYIWNGEPYKKLVHEKFHYIVASHVIEHSPDLINFLNNISDILTRKGYLFLSIPDKRYCFDHYRSETNIEDILNAHLDNHKKPTRSNIMEHYSCHTHNDPIMHWAGEHGEVSDHSLTEQEILEKIELSNYEYVDTHVWKFTPDNFVQIINYLYNNSIIKLRIKRIYPTLFNTFEFFCIMEKNPWKRVKSLHKR